MKAIVLTSTGYRHRYFASAIAKHFEVLAVITEEKKNYYTTQREESLLVQEHFKRLSESEKKWFENIEESDVPPSTLVSDINSEETLKWAKSLGADCICLFGTAILKSNWIEAFSDKIINLHLGLSPYYRGSATLFWPFAFRELEFLGTTIHLAIEKVDAGAILHRVQPKFVSGDDYYAVTNRLIRDSIDLVASVTKKYLDGSVTPKQQESVSGRLCKKADFSEEALNRMLDYVGDGLSQSEIARIEDKRCHYSL